MKIYCNVCNKYRKSKKKSKKYIFLKKHEVFLLLTVSGVINMKNI